MVNIRRKTMPDHADIKDFLNRKLPKDKDTARFVILKDGRWFHDGGEIKRIELVKLFSTILKCDDKGQHWLEIPTERHKVDVEDSAYVSKSIDFQGADIKVTTNLDTQHLISKNVPLIMDAGIPYIKIEKGLKIRLLRSHYYELVESAEEKNGELVVYSDGKAYSLGRINSED
tara:strand:- start:225 stop:743 length:519 start_codon:yes stop_codon:yes gene_type:complete